MFTSLKNVQKYADSCIICEEFGIRTLNSISRLYKLVSTSIVKEKVELLVMLA